MSKIQRPNEIQGSDLRPAVSIGEDYAKSINVLITAMHREIINGIKELTQAYGQDSELPENGSIAAQARIWVNYLLKKYRHLFAKLAKRSTSKMVDRIMRNSAATLKMSLRDMAGHLFIKTDYMDDRLRDISIAASTESANMIKTIPEQYLGDVQKAVLRSVASGRGYTDLVPFFQQYYRANKRKAKLQAMNQTRAFYANVNAARMEKLGIEEFIWVHSGGGRDPRKEHVEMDGKIFRLDDLPVIYHDKGIPIRGLPGQAANCRCVMRPLLNFRGD